MPGSSIPNRKAGPLLFLALLAACGGGGNGGSGTGGGDVAGGSDSTGSGSGSTDNQPDDTGTSPGEVGFVSATANVDEGAGSILLLVQRIGGSDGIVTVDYSTTGNAALANIDFGPVTNTLTWADGDVSQKIIQIDIAEDTEVEGAESFTVHLINPSGGPTLGTTLLTVTIDDNDLAPPSGVFDTTGYDGSVFSEEQASGTFNSTIFQ